MGRLFFIGLLTSASLAALARPWIGVVASYVIVVLTPQAVWWWNFQGLRPAYWVLLPTFVGLAIALANKRISFAPLKNKLCLFMAVLWLAFAMSYWLGPYVDSTGPFRFHDPAQIFSMLNKVFILYFVACICIDDAYKLKTLFYALCACFAYLTYWANDQYFSGHVFGRLAGPVDIYGDGAYADENHFAMAFVVAQPFLWYLGYGIQTRVLRWAVWLVIPFTWHAIFLTASRGGLIGIAAVTLLMTMRSKSRLYGLLLIPAFIFAYQWQAGDLMKSRAETIGEYKTETSASTRLEAWGAASGMIAAWPLTGVGLASFGPAFPDYSDKKPREAHNTFFQITAESGVPAGSCYILVMLYSILGLWRLTNRLRKQQQNVLGSPHHFTYLIAEANLVALVGFAICALFLSLQISEVFY
ncbi:MAG: O-antigen ligase family protein, partial [Steroidobacteraceae bacterium]